MFNCIIFTIACALYLNTINGTYVWDDRAAIISNQDVYGLTSLYDLLEHDFWGQDIKLEYSHKSFRPLTVLSYRLNYLIHGSSAQGYHVGNILIYGFTCLMVYKMYNQWLNRVSARLATVLFTFHPIHVEAVASLVGRADCLCGLFYLASAILYTNAIRRTGTSKPLFLLAYLTALAASLTKEIGVTVLGMFFMLEIISAFPSSSLSKRKGLSPAPVQVQANGTHVHGTHVHVPVLAYRVLLRMSVSLAAFLGFAAWRLRLNGAYRLYRWTVMENHVSLLPDTQARVLSYAQTHFWYAFKLVYPRHLCFDYGYACIPTVRNVLDVRNLLPLAAYCTLAVLVTRAVRAAGFPGRGLGLGPRGSEAGRGSEGVSLLVGLCWLVLPLVPALNVFMPVGTLLAERLLLVPSVGFCMLAADCIVADGRDCLLYSADVLLHLLAVTDSPGPEPSQTAATPGSSTVRTHRKRDKKPGAGSRASASSAGSGFGKGLATLRSAAELESVLQLCVLGLLLPVLGLMAVRVVTRNADWNDELSIYRSALHVCPNSVKALANYAALTVHMKDEERIALRAADKAVYLYKGQVAAFVNVGLLSQSLGLWIRSIRFYDIALKLNPLDGKALGYLGNTLLMWASKHEHSPEFVAHLSQRSVEVVDRAIVAGFDTPNALHARGSLAMESKDSELAVRYFRAALQKSADRRMSDAPELIKAADNIDESRTLNQLGNALSNLGKVDEAIATFEEALLHNPSLLAIHVNLGSLYRSSGRLADAMQILEEGKRIAGNSCPSALLNNLGLVHLDEGNAEQSLRLFNEALDRFREERAQEMVLTLSSGAESSMKVSDGGAGSVEDLILYNINRAETLGVKGN